MPIQIHCDVDDTLSFPHTPRHEDCPLPVEGPEKSLAALRNCVLPGTGDAGWMRGGVPDSQTQAVASQPVSWHELLESYPSVSAPFSAFIDPRTRPPHAEVLVVKGSPGRPPDQCVRFIHLALGDPMQKRSYYRAGWIKFEEDADMPTVMSSLSEKKVRTAVHLGA